jgi:hypothetical protein
MEGLALLLLNVRALWESADHFVKNVSQINSSIFLQKITNLRRLNVANKVFREETCSILALILCVQGGT